VKVVYDFPKYRESLRSLGFKTPKNGKKLIKLMTAIRQQVNKLMKPIMKAMSAKQIRCDQKIQVDAMNLESESVDKLGQGNDH